MKNWKFPSFIASSHNPILAIAEAAVFNIHTLESFTSTG